MVIQLWRQIPPHICWSVWKERNNRIFKEAETSLDNVFSSYFKMLMDNIFMTRWKTPSNPPNLVDRRITEHWKLPLEFKLFNNTSKINTKSTKWLAPSPSLHKLNFDG